MTRNQRRLGFILAALAISAGLYGVWWTNAAVAAKAELERWIEARRSSGFDIQHDGIETAGFPLKIDLVVANPKVSRQGRTPFTWQGPEKLIAHIVPLAPNHLALEAAGHHLLSRGEKQMTLLLGAAKAELDANESGLAGLHLEVKEAALEGAFSTPINLGALSLDLRRRYDVAPDDLQNPAASLALSLERLTLPPDAKSPLGPEVQKLSAVLNLMGPFPENLGREPLAAWSEAGGILDLERLYLEWPPLTLEGDGTLALDKNLLPIAPFGLKAKGVFETVDALSQAGLIDTANALPVKLALAVLAKEPPDPQTGLMRLPLTLQGRDLFIGPARVARLPRLPWEEE